LPISHPDEQQNAPQKTKMTDYLKKRKPLTSKGFRYLFGWLSMIVGVYLPMQNIPFIDYQSVTILGKYDTML
jgi:hypothetical protein